MDLMQVDLLLIRHGTTRWNREKRYLGHTDQGLAPDSLQELMPLRDQLAGLSPAMVYSSDLIRCRETLKIIGPAYTDTAVYESRLREMDFGDWEGRTYEELKDIPLYREWLDAPQQVTPPRGESWNDFELRIKGFMKSLLSELEGHKPNKTGSSSASVLVVTHGGVIRQLGVLLVPGLSFWDIHLKPGGLLKLRLILQDDGWTGLMPEEE